MIHMVIRSKPQKCVEEVSCGVEGAAVHVAVLCCAREKAARTWGMDLDAFKLGAGSCT